MEKLTQRGVSLVELLVSLTVTAIIAASVVSAISLLVQKYRMGASVNQVITTLMSARSEAVHLNEPVVICKSADGVTCTNGSFWEQGWIVFVDKDADRTRDPDEPRTASFGELGHGFTLRSGELITDKIVFNTDGSVDKAETFSLCPIDGSVTKAKSIVVNATGQSKVSHGVNSCPT